MCVQCRDPNCHRPNCDSVREHELEDCIRDILDAARAERPETEVTCISFRTLQDGQEIVQMRPPAEVLNQGCAGTRGARIRAKELLVLQANAGAPPARGSRQVTLVVFSDPAGRTRSAPAENRQ
jgi:hypothetical protein